MFEALRRFVFALLTNSAPVHENISIEKWQRHHSRLIVRQIQSCLSLQPVALIAEGLGAVTLAFTFWEQLEHLYVFLWLGFIGVHIYAAMEFARRFWADRSRHARIRLWVRAWMILAAVAGLIWGAAGSVFAVSPNELMETQVLLVSVILTVTFASWPVYACWLPSLGVFTLLSLSPLVLRMALFFGWSRLAIAILLVGVIIFIFYSGRRFSDIVQRSVRNEQESEVMVKRLTLEKNLAERLRRETEEKSRIRAKFFQAANHDIRQPLQAIGIYIELLKRINDPQVKAIVEQLANTTGTLQKLVAQILEVSRLETRHMTATPEPINVGEVLEDLYGEFLPIAEKKGIGLRVKMLDATIFTDRALLMRALRNLITNAINYTAEGEIVLAARLLGGRRVSLCVVDSGAGIEASEQKKIFEHFYRSESTRESAEGFGLGLSIVRAICEQMHLRLSLNSKPGRGTIFRIEAPLHEVEQVRIFKEARVRSQEIKPVDASVILIEDNAIVRESLAALVSAWGLRVVAFAALTQELRDYLLSTPKVDAVISDYNLGNDVENGLEVMLYLNRTLDRKLPSILLTAVGEDKIRDDYRNILAGLTEHDAGYFALPVILQKPVTGEVLNETLREIIGEAPSKALR